MWLLNSVFLPIWLLFSFNFVKPDLWDDSENAAVHLSPQQAGVENIFGAPTRPDFRVARCNPFYQRCSPTSNLNPQLPGGHLVPNTGINVRQQPDFYPPLPHSYLQGSYQPANVGPPAAPYYPPQQPIYQPQSYQQPQQSYYGSQPNSYGSQPASYGSQPASYGSQPAFQSYQPYQPTQSGTYQPATKPLTGPTAPPVTLTPNTGPSVATTTYGYEYGRISTSTIGGNNSLPSTTSLPITTSATGPTQAPPISTTTKRRPPLGVDNFSATELLTTASFEEPTVSNKPSPLPPSTAPDRPKPEPLTTPAPSEPETSELSVPLDKRTLGTVKPTVEKLSTLSISTVQPTGYYIKAIGELWPGSLIRSNDVSPNDSGKKPKFLQTPENSEVGRISKGIGGDLCLCPCRPS